MLRIIITIDVYIEKRSIRCFFVEKTQSEIVAAH